MLQKAKSATTSSKSSTSKSSAKAVSSSTSADGTGADTPIQFVKGVGPKLGFLLKSRGLATVRDLFHFFPRAYEDRTKLKKVSQVLEGENATLTVKLGA
jgi:RecG-like helicase